MIIGIVLIVLGVVGLLFPITHYTTREPVNLFGLRFTAEKQNTLVIPGIVGGLALVGGIAVVVVASRKSA
ncbi:MAG: DUF3185 domain-containing protein [Phycisphaerae bacterium]|nr:DUF3185 domain-containing protein [Phycisphaerae bacterium]